MIRVTIMKGQGSWVPYVKVNEILSKFCKTMISDDNEYASYAISDEDYVIAKMMLPVDLRNYLVVTRS